MFSPWGSGVNTWVPWGTGTGSSSISLGVNTITPEAGTGAGSRYPIWLRNSMYSLPGRAFIRSTVWWNMVLNSSARAAPGSSSVRSYRHSGV